MNAASELIRDARRRHRLSQRSLARRCGTSQTYVSRVEAGELSPSVETLTRLLAAMGEELELRTVSPSGNSSDDELRDDYRCLSAEERIEQAADLSFALTSIASAPRLARDR